VGDRFADGDIEVDDDAAAAVDEAEGATAGELCDDVALDDVVPLLLGSADAAFLLAPWHAVRVAMATPAAMVAVTMRRASMTQPPQ
jgi:hypothetical protein